MAVRTEHMNAAAAKPADKRGLIGGIHWLGDAGTRNLHEATETDKFFDSAGFMEQFRVSLRMCEDDAHTSASQTPYNLPKINEQSMRHLHE